MLYNQMSYICFMYGRNCNNFGKQCWTEMKQTANYKSSLLGGCKTYLSEHPHFAFLETMSL
jgi:hypothetical protein